MGIELPRARWTARRVLNTAWYAFVGALIGPAMCVVCAVVGGLIVGLITSALGLDTALAIAFGVIVGLGVLALAYLIVRAASYGTCKRHPTAPAGIAAGIAGGILLAWAIFLYASAVWIVPGVLIVAGVLAAAGYHGGARAVRETLGAVREGVGKMCAHCGYDLSSTPEGWVCPECGGIMRHELAAPA